MSVRRVGPDSLDRKEETMSSLMRIACAVALVIWHRRLVVPDVAAPESARATARSATG